MVLTDIVIDIHEQETGAPMPPDVVAALRDLAETYDVDRQPSWLLPIFQGIQRGDTSFAPVFFESESSDPHSYLLELTLLLGWKHDHAGEYEEIVFPRLGRRVYMSHEARSPVTGRGGSTYLVTDL